MAKPIPPDPYAVAPPDPYAQAAPSAYDHASLVRLQSQVGATPQEAERLARIAYAESTGNPANNGPNYTENGKTYHGEGLWMISTIHGFQNMHDATENAKRALELYRSQGTKPWEDSRSKGAGGGWGKYDQVPPDPYAQPQRLPHGGFASVIHAQDHPIGGVPSFVHAPSGWEQSISDTMNRAIGTIVSAGHKFFTPSQAEAAALPPGYKGEPESYKTPAQQKAYDARRTAAGLPNIGATQPVAAFETRADTRLSKTLKTVGDLGDALTYAPANALTRDLAGNHAEGMSLWFKTLLDPMNPEYNAGKALDQVANEYGFNAPGDIKYWASQPGMRSRILEAKPTTPQGAMLQVALGMHADLARLKPKYPYAAGAETFVGEAVNPFWLAAGEVGSGIGALTKEGLAAARMGSYGSTTQKLAVLATKAPMFGNRFVDMYDAGGEVWAHQHAVLARDMGNIPHIANDKFTSTDTYGGATLPQQVEIVHGVENPGSLGRMGTMIGNLTLGDRARNVAGVIRQTESALRNVDPEMAKVLIAEPYHTHVGAWDLPSSQRTSSRWESQSIAPPAGGPSATSGVIPRGRLHDTLEEGQNAGLNIDPDWAPSGAAAMHEAKLQRYIALANYVKSFETLTTKGGKPGSFDIEYLWPQAGGSYRSLGTGAQGYDHAMQVIGGAAKNKADAEAAAKGASLGWKQEQIDKWASDRYGHYQEVAIDDMRKIFRSQHPDYDFDARDSLGMPMLKGKALHNAAVNAAIDSHPSLLRLQMGKTPERFAAHTMDEPIDNPFMTWMDNLNSVVRQGILANVGFHPAFNLVPLALNAGVNPKWLARAVALDRQGVLVPKAWLDRATQYRATAPKFGTALSMDPMARAKLLTVPYDGLSPTEMMQKAFLSGSKWNQDVTFGYFEDRISAVTMHHFEEQGMSPEAAAMETRRWLGDYENMTRAERTAGLRNWQYFYTWMRGQLRLWAGQMATKPQQIMAPIRGVQTANEQQGDAGSAAGNALSLRSMFGTDAHGNPRYVSLPFPMFRYGSDAVRMTAGFGNDLTEPFKVAGSLALNHLPPLASLAINAIGTPLMEKAVPEPYNEQLWDQDAPNVGVMMWQAAQKMADRFAPSVVRAPIEALQQKDPTRLIGALGPTVYSSPNSGIRQKAAYAVQQDLRSAVRRAKSDGNSTLANHLYGLLLRVNDDDPLAALQARRELRELNRARRGASRPST